MIIDFAPFAKNAVKKTFTEKAKTSKAFKNMSAKNAGFAGFALFGQVTCQEEEHSATLSVLLLKSIRI
ncbi:hypothetical protein HYU12_05555 [Candidatus Woesearchaeota archaeon]|nr:hypothetical protein [Candidatus Woesearchaeota archaeon]